MLQFYVKKNMLKSNHVVNLFYYSFIAFIYNFCSYLTDLLFNMSGMTMENLNFFQDNVFDKAYYSDHIIISYSSVIIKL